MITENIIQKMISKTTIESAFGIPVTEKSTCCQKQDYINKNTIKCEVINVWMNFEKNAL